MKNNNRFLAISLLFILLTSMQYSLAEKLELNPNHPDQYTVQAGDTLWDISGRFLAKPWYWPEIWQNNSQIENPHLIYPGDQILLSFVNGRPVLSKGRGKGTIKLSPQIRIEELDQAIPTIALDKINPFLSGNIILPKGELEAAPYIVGIDDGHLSAGADNSIFVQGIDENTEDTKYSVYRFGQIYRNPSNSKEILGYEAIYLGDGVLDKRGSPATIYMQTSKDAILAGHRVLPIEEDKVFDAQFTPKAATVERSGTIVGVLTNASQPGVTMVGALDVGVIDMGLRDGVGVGDVFNIYWH